MATVAPQTQPTTQRPAAAPSAPAPAPAPTPAQPAEGRRSAEPPVLWTDWYCLLFWLGCAAVLLLLHLIDGIQRLIGLLW